MKLKKILFSALLLFIPLTASAGLSDYWENHLADMLFRGQTYTLPSMYLGLSTASVGGVDDTGCPSEVSTSGTNYARAQLTLSEAAWNSTGPSGTTGVASTGTNGTISNATTITVGSGTASADWGTVNYACIWDAPSGGNLLWYFQLTNSQTISTNANVPTFPAGTLTFQVDQ